MPPAYPRPPAPAQAACISPPTKPLPTAIVNPDAPSHVNPAAAMPPLSGPACASLEEVEKEAILKTLETARGNKSEAARRLGITRRTLHQKLRKYAET